MHSGEGDWGIVLHTPIGRELLPSIPGCGGPGAGLYQPALLPIDSTCKLPLPSRLHPSHSSFHCSTVAYLNIQVTPDFKPQLHRLYH